MVALNKRRDSKRLRVSFRDMMLMLIGAVLASLVMVIFMKTPQSSLSSRPTLLAQMAPEISSSTTMNQQLLEGSSGLKGWHSIHIFYGDMDHLVRTISEKWWLKNSPKHRQGGKWFSQHGQDVAVAKALNFKKSGFFVDLAANNAVWASNTFGLEQNFDWKGICIEPNSFYWQDLSYRNCHVVGAVIGAHDMEEVNVTLGQNKGSGPFGGIVGKQFDNKHVKKPELRYTVSLKTILKEFGAPAMIDYLSLDVEGAETFIMKNFPWSEYKFLCLTIERPSIELQTILKEQGYKKVISIKRGDTFWVHHSIYEQAQANLAKYPEEVEEHAVKHFP